MSHIWLFLVVKQDNKGVNNMNQEKYYDSHGELIQGGDLLIRVEYVSDSTDSPLIKVVDTDGKYVSDLGYFYRREPIENCSLKDFMIYKSFADVPKNVSALNRESERTGREIAQLEREAHDINERISALILYRGEVSVQLHKMNTVQSKIDIKQLKSSRRHRTGVGRIKQSRNF